MCPCPPTIGPGSVTARRSSSPSANWLVPYRVGLQYFSTAVADPSQPPRLADASNLTLLQIAWRVSAGRKSAAEVSTQREPRHATTTLQSAGQCVRWGLGCAHRKGVGALCNGAQTRPMFPFLHNGLQSILVNFLRPPQRIALAESRSVMAPAELCAVIAAISQDASLSALRCYHSENSIHIALHATSMRHNMAILPFDCPCHTLCWLMLAHAGLWAHAGLFAHVRS